MLRLDTIVQLLEHYGYVFLFIIAVVEGPIVTIIGAFLAGLGYFNIFAVYVVVSVGDLSGDVLYYAVGRLGRIGAFAGLRRALGMTGERFARMEQYIERHGGKILLFAKYTQTGFLALPASGAARMPMGKFLWYNTLGTIPKSLVLVIVGYFFGYAYVRIDGYFAKSSMVMVAIVCIAGAYILLSRYLRAISDER
ncbi:MAG: VTT domain-containing protein [Rhizomicrobium sp.]|jgi:membrane protein DedA with SNARE-associated domain